MIKTLLRDLAGLRVAVLFLFFGLLAAGAVGQEFEANPMAYSDLGLPNPTVTSDKEDYSPGMTAIISGTGWTEDSIVDVHIEEEPIHVHHHGFHSTKVNADGTWAIEYPITEDHVGVKFTVIVDGLTSKYQGFHNFTDAGIANVYVNATTFCSGGGITVSFRAAANSGPVNGGFNNDNSFIAELSNENGSFDSPVLIGIIDAKHDNNNDQTITGILPSTILAGGDYRVRVRSTSPVTNAPTSTSFIISATPEQVNAGLDQSVCPSGAVILGASNAGGESGIWSITSGPELSLGQFSNLSDPETEFSPEDKGVYTLRWTVINNCGESFDEINITVADNTAPVWVAESLSGNQLNVSMDPGECGATITWSDPTATDNCASSLSVVRTDETGLNSGDLFPAGTTVISYSVTDENENTSTHSFTVTVNEDAEAPDLFDVPNDVTVNCDVIPVAANVTATDNCDTTISVELVESNDQIADVNDPGHYNYTITRTWTATDVAGNTTSDVQVITVQDVTKPNLVDVPNDVTVNCDVIPVAANVTATDNCDTTISVELVESNDQVADVNDAGHYNYTITRTWTATDVAGNTTSDFQVITVQDVTKPNLVDVPNDVTVKCDVIPVAANVTATDNCDTTISVVLVQENTQVADVNDPGHYNYTITRTWTATDVAGNTTSDVQLITVQDVNGPIISTEAKDITVESNGEGNGKEFDDWISDNGGAFALDNCSEVTWSYNILSTSDECGDTGIKKVEFIAIDVTGNSNTTEATFTIKDETAPDLSAINAPIDPVQVDVPIYLSATYKEVNPVGATWYFSSDGDFTDGDTAEFSLEANATGRTITNTFTSDLFITAENSKGAGVYSVKLVVVDACENSSETTYDYIVIYDPEGGFVTGGGWIYSEPGSMPYNTSAEGKANFGFNAKYKNGKNNMNEVDGNTNFQFKEGDFHFKSSSHDDMSLVISGAKATYRGVGTVNGSGKHKFMVTAIDGDLIGKTDKFRIRVWANNSSSDVIYDNELTASENAEATTELGGGSIVIHKPKGNGKGKGVEAIAAKPEVEIEDILKTLEAYPNPVVRTAEIRFSLKASANATLKVYDFNGREVAHLFQGKVEEGQAYEVPFDRRNLMPGVYIYRLTTDQGQVYHKQLIIK